MALSAGTVSVDEEGNVSGSGLALAIFNGGLGALDEDKREAVAEAMAPFCQGVAEAIVTHITENAEVTVSIQVTDTGLQRTPNPNNPDTDTQGPSGVKTLVGTIA